MSDRAYLSVPFAEKDHARSLGARWDPAERRWYVPPDVAIEPFARWFPEVPPDPGWRMLAPIWLLEGSSGCWSCGRAAAVFCLACRDVREADDERDCISDPEELLVISDLVALDSRIERHLNGLARSYQPDWSGTKRTRCWMNHCGQCGAKLGDFFLHQEPGGAFFISEAADWHRLRRHLLEPGGEYSFDGAYSLP